MISSLLSRYMIEKITTKPVPMINPKKCINQLQKRQSCQLCQTLCLHEAISFEPQISINSELCQNCGLCSSICPTGTMVQPLEVVEKQYNAINKGHDVVISCEKEQEQTDLKVSCLAALPWEFLAYIAIERRAKLITRHCETCEKRDCFNHLTLTLKRLETFLKPKGYEEQVLLINESSEGLQSQYSRRELFKLWTEESKRLITEVAPIKFEKNKNARIYRSLLMKKIKGMDHGEYGWCGIEVNDNCYGCGICETVCPQQAISITQDDDNQRFFEHDYSRCTHCGLCETVCLERAIEKIIRFKDGYHPSVKTSISSNSCCICQDPIKPEEGEICIICEREQSEQD